MTKEEIKQLAQIVFKKINEWVERTPEAEREDAEFETIIDDLELPEELQGTWEFVNEWTGKSYTYDVETVLNGCLYAAAYYNEEPITLQDVIDLIEEGIKNVTRD